MFWRQTGIEAAPKQTLVLPPRLRAKLKHPLGTLIRGSPNQTIEQLHKLILKEKPGIVISVGDAVSQNMLRHGIVPQLMIVDNKIMRAAIEPFNVPTKSRISVENPAGTLTVETWAAVASALKKEEPVLMLVEGEEDLLTLVTILKAPENTLVVYGQPREGIVAVKVGKTSKERVLRIVKGMEPLPKA